MNNPKYLAQSAGWMASPHEIMEYHQKLCVAGFLPPYDGERVQLDGLHLHNVEFWSGGIQLWCDHCNVQRIVLVDETFGNHLLYHTANNKQHIVPVERLVRVVDYWGQLQSVIHAAQQEKSTSGS